MIKKGLYIPNKLIVFFLIFPEMMLARQMERLLPENPGNEYKIADTRIYTGKKLYEYIDGGAELYLSYHYRKCLSRRYIHDSEPEILAEIFDMGISWNAFGVFSNMRENENKEFGQGSQRLKGSVLFWKGRYIVSIMTPKETDVSEKTMVQIASFADSAIMETGQLPSVLSHLPPKGLSPENILYFIHWSWQNAYYFLSSDDILLMGTNTPAVWARYGAPENRIFLLLVQYRSNRMAEKACHSFWNAFGSGTKSGLPARLEDGTYFAMIQYKNLLCGVFNASSQRDIEYLTEEVKKSVFKQNH